MKKYTIFGICCLVLLISAASVHARGRGGFAGPGAPASAGNSGSRWRYQPAAVSELASFSHKSRIILTGNIVNSTRREYYTFRDATGEVIVEIERKYWRGVTVGPNDRVEIRAELERKRDGRIEVEASRRIRRL